VRVDPEAVTVAGLQAFVNVERWRELAAPSDKDRVCVCTINAPEWGRVVREGRPLVAFAPNRQSKPRERDRICAHAAPPHVPIRTGLSTSVGSR